MMDKTTDLVKECILLAMKDIRGCLKNRIEDKNPTFSNDVTIPVCTEALAKLSEAYKNITTEA